ncbi:hypothetical protein GOBAR_AA09630 [Gossypium barbadense]|uniref:Uncharacterized protein n=1 Tax=Gossypium barbadense TaxID=3634 RepID=A0A2P5Y648_GOSBA|nr:hypothetical protein GOBAR_AA09630 [Gossypium barbadense]
MGQHQNLMVTRNDLKLFKNGNQSPGVAPTRLSPGTPRSPLTQKLVVPGFVVSGTSENGKSVPNFPPGCVLPAYGIHTKR